MCDNLKIASFSHTHSHPIWSNWLFSCHLRFLHFDIIHRISKCVLTMQTTNRQVNSHKNVTSQYHHTDCFANHFTATGKIYWLCKNQQRQQQQQQMNRNKWIWIKIRLSAENKSRAVFFLWSLWRMSSQQR